MSIREHNGLDLAVPEGQRPAALQALSRHELSIVSAICSRVMRIIGLLDREGLQRDIAIVQTHCPLDLDGLAAAPDQLFVKELLNILDSTERSAGSLRSNFRSCFMLEVSGLALI